MISGEVITRAAVDPPHEEQGPISIRWHAILEYAAVMVEVTTARDVSNRETEPFLLAHIGMGAVDESWMEQHHLSSFERDIDGVGLVEGIGRQGSAERLPQAIGPLMPRHLLVRAGNHPQTAIRDPAPTQGDPRAGSDQWVDRPIYTVLMPGRR